MIALLEEEYNYDEEKYILHLTMDPEDDLEALPTAEQPFGPAFYNIPYNYGEPATNSTAVDEVSGDLFIYQDGEWKGAESEDSYFSGFINKYGNASWALKDKNGNTITPSTSDSSYVYSMDGYFLLSGSGYKVVYNVTNEQDFAAECWISTYYNGVSDIDYRSYLDASLGEHVLELPDGCVGFFVNEHN